MLFAALVLTAALCAAFALLPGRLLRRTPSRRDAFAGAGVFLAAWAWSAGVYSKPGLAVGFDAFRLASVCAGTAWAAALVCGVRLLRGAPNGGQDAELRLPRPLAVAALALLFALGGEVFLCNLQYFATHAYQPIQLLDYLSADSTALRNADGTLTLDPSHTTLRFAGMDQPLYNLQLDNLTYLYDGDSPDEQNPLFRFVVSAADSASVYERQGWAWDVALKAPRSLTRALDLSGKVSTLTLLAEPYSGESIWYSFAYTLTGVTANTPRPMEVSAVRAAVLFLAFCAVWALRPGSALWRQSYLAHRKACRPAAALCALALAVLAAAAPFADPVNSGVATAHYNVNNWDGVSRVSFTKHISDWQHDAFAAQYGSLAHSLLSGRLDLELDPSEALLAMDNPYDTGLRSQQAPDALWDVALYKGRYYVYFGIVPCLLFQLPFEALTGVQDLPPAFGMIVMGLLLILAAFGLVKQAVFRWFPHASTAAYLLCAVGLVTGSQLYYLLLRPAVYEYAILCGASFLLLALWQWMCAANTPAERPGRIAAHLALGSLCMALVAGCRPQMELFAFLALPILWRRYIAEKRLFTRRGAAEFAAFALPVVLVAAGLMWYNAARFGSPFDFGANYNLTSNDMTQRGFTVGRIGPALFTYFFAPPALHAVFPYLSGTRMATNYMGMTITELYYGGVLACLPLLWGLAGWPALRRRIAAKHGLAPLLGWTLAASVLMAVVDCEMAGVLYRYLSDFSPVLLFAAALCWLAAEEGLRAHAAAFAGMAKLQTALRGALAGAVALGAAYGFCVFFAASPGLYGQNPALFQNVSRLVQFWL